MKLSKKDLMQRVSDLVEDDEKKVAILEDLEDSILEEGSIDEVEKETLRKEKEDLEWKYQDLLTRYKERFLQGKDSEEKEDIKDELEEKEVIDIKEI